MNISRQLALEIFGLKENFTKEDVVRKFRGLSKIVHPDTGGDENLFKFIICCKETLLNNSKANNASQTYEPPKPRESKKKSVFITLPDLYDFYYVLDIYSKQYDIIEIRGKARIFITPYVILPFITKQKYCESTIIKFSQPFSEFKELDFANFFATVKLSENLKKFQKFKIRVEFMGKTFNFKLTMNSPFHIVKYENILKFNSIIELTFKWQNIG